MHTAVINIYDNIPQILSPNITKKFWANNKITAAAKDISVNYQNNNSKPLVFL